MQMDYYIRNVNNIEGATILSNFSIGDYMEGYTVQKNQNVYYLGTVPDMLMYIFPHCSIWVTCKKRECFPWRWYDIDEGGC